MSQHGEQTPPVQDGLTQHDIRTASVGNARSVDREEPESSNLRRFPTLYGVLIALNITTLLITLKRVSLFHTYQNDHYVRRFVRWIIPSIEGDFSTSSLEELEALLLSEEFEIDQKKLLVEKQLNSTIGSIQTTVAPVLLEEHSYCHIDMLKGFYMRLHQIIGPVSPSFTNEVDDIIAGQYGPLRHLIASGENLSTHDDEDGKEIAILRLSRQYHPLQQISQDCLEAAGRVVNLDDPNDISLYYQQVEERKNCALASKEERSLLLEGAVGFLCLSYRHRKHSREELGLSQMDK